jgi:diguanylate cyclase (GGDEF)-like protein
MLESEWWVQATRGHGTRLWQAFALVMLAATVAYVLDLSPAVNTAAFAVVGVGCVSALVVGPRLVQARPRTAWRWIAVASVLFLLGALVRPFLTDETGWALLVGDMFSIPGYFCVITGVGLLLRSRGGLQRHAVLDGVLVCLGAGLASALLLAVPAASVEGRSVLVSILAALYPFFDVALILVLINMAFTTAVWRASFVALLLSGVAMVTGDLAYAVLSTEGRVYGSPLIDVAFFVAFSLMGVSALHPSAADLGRATRPPVQAWSWPRLSLLIPSLAAPFVLQIAVGARSSADRMALAAGGIVMVTMLVARAITAVQAQVAAQLRAEHQATHDALTGLPNRRMISTDIERLLRSVPPDGPRRVWVYYLDLDGFKFVNDSWGHDAGDQLVIEVARRLGAGCPPGTLLARVGGDEYVLVNVGDAEHADRTLVAIRNAFAEPVPVRGIDVVVSSSIGYAHAGADAAPTLTAEALLRDADTAMYRSKGEGPGRVTLFDASMHDQVRQRVELEASLRGALGRDELWVAFQPIVELTTGRPVGAEALLRWNHPDRGPVPPDVFIPIAENAGLIAVIGAFVREESIRQLAAWRADGVVDDDFWLSINVSPRQLREADLAGSVADELMRHQVPPRVIVLEITESVMVDSSSRTDEVLLELRQLGIRLAVDDFGTGFSALGYLRRFPVTGVKIDRSFVSGLGNDSSDEEIVRAVVAMSTALGLSIVAEGIETNGQRDALAVLGVGLGQGWLWGKAVPAEQFATDWQAQTQPAAGPARTQPQLAAGNS